MLTNAYKLTRCAIIEHMSTLSEISHDADDASIHRIFLYSLENVRATEQMARHLYTVLSADHRHVVRFQAISESEPSRVADITLSAPLTGTTLPRYHADSQAARLEAVTNLHVVERMTKPDVVVVTGTGMHNGMDPLLPQAGVTLAADLQTAVFILVSGTAETADELHTSIVSAIDWVRAGGAHVAGVFVTSPDSDQPVDIPSYVSSVPVWSADQPDDATVVKLALTPVPAVVTPAAFQYALLEKARSAHKTIVLPESEDRRVLTAANYLLDQNIVSILLCGKEEDIRERAESFGLHAIAERAKIITPQADLLTKMAKRLVEIRSTSRKPVTFEQAFELVSEPSYFGTMCVEMGLADGMVSGAIHSTADTVRPALQIIKARPGHNLVSGAMFMCLSHRVDLYADVALLPNPTAEQLAQIAIESAHTARRFGLNPVVGLLSYSTGTSGKGPDVDLVREATNIVHKREPELAVTGPIQFDAAWSPEVAHTKAPDDRFAGHVNVFILPDLSSSNVAIKAVQRVGHAVAIGPILQGLTKPINDLSRGTTARDIINTIAVTAIEA